MTRVDADSIDGVAVSSTPGKLIDDAQPQTTMCAGVHVTVHAIRLDPSDAAREASPCVMCTNKRNGVYVMMCKSCGACVHEDCLMSTASKTTVLDGVYTRCTSCKSCSEVMVKEVGVLNVALRGEADDF